MMFPVRSTRVVLLAAIALAPDVAGAQQLMVRSDDGRAVLVIGGPLNGASISLRRLPDGDDVAGAAGSHYRIETPLALLPPNTTLAIRWDTASRPGGVPLPSMIIMRRSGGGWEPAQSRAGGVDSLVAVVSAPGDFAVRWFAGRRCEGSAYRAIDFRLGAWDYRAPGYTPGKSVVTRDPSQCALFDHYVDLEGARSTSMFFLDNATGRWFNTTIDPGGRFVSIGTAEQDGIAFYHSPTDREVFRRRPDGTVSFAAERSGDQGKTWTAWATATYTPVP